MRDSALECDSNEYQLVMGCAEYFDDLSRSLYGAWVNSGGHGD